ncbi:MAG: hypothetical protein AAGF98_11305 [Cyanobacteria bacterium P01_H01_bin.153]
MSKLGNTYLRDTGAGTEFMRLLKKIVIGLLLLCGLPISLMAIVYGFNPETSQEDKDGAIAAFIFFGLPPVVISGLLMHSLHQQHKSDARKSDRELEQLFLAELQANGGNINPIIFATKSDLTLDETKIFLDEKAVQLNALYEATETGGVIYRFPL